MASPFEIPQLYNRLNSIPESLTIVYIPGIYDSIFDHEIFRVGLDGLYRNFGVRVIAPPGGPVRATPR